MSPRWTDTPEGIAIGGPRAFEYDLEYKALGKYVEQSVHDQPSSYTNVPANDRYQQMGVTEDAENRACKCRYKGAGGGRERRVSQPVVANLLWVALDVLPK
jgi:hypothetical protein